MECSGRDVRARAQAVSAEVLDATIFCNVVLHAFLLNQGLAVQNVRLDDSDSDSDSSSALPLSLLSLTLT